MIEALQNWFRSRQPDLDAAGITVFVSPPTSGLDKNSIHAELRTSRFEYTVQLWETGECDIHRLDWEAMDDGVTVTHWEFSGDAEMYNVLDEVVASFVSPLDATSSARATAAVVTST